MTQVSILGVGLIGGSLGLALRRLRRQGKRLYFVTGWGRSASRLKQAKKRGAVDVFSTNLKVALAKADIIVLCTPVQDMALILKAGLPYIKKGAILTDVGSVKRSVLSHLRRVLARRKDVLLVGGHPVAGSDKSGVVHATPHLFRGAPCVLITDGAHKTAFNKVKSLWRGVGARCIGMKAQRHDAILALTSHLPHLLSFALTSLVKKAAQQDSYVSLLTAGSFRDMTRIASSSPRLWEGIFKMNQEELRRSLQAFQKTMNKLSH